MLVVRDARAFSYREQKRTFPFGLSAGEGRGRMSLLSAATRPGRAYRV